MIDPSKTFISEVTLIFGTLHVTSETVKLLEKEVRDWENSDESPREFAQRVLGKMLGVTLL